MDLTIIREWLIQNSIPAEELDQTVEPEALRDLDEILKTTLENDNHVGLLVTEFFVHFGDMASIVLEQQMKILAMENEIDTLNGGQ